MVAPGKTDVDLEALRAVSMIQEPTPLGDWLVVMPVLIPFVAGALLIMLRQRIGWHVQVAAAAFLLLVLSNIALIARVADQGVVVMTMGRWLAPFGIAFSVDMVSALFALAASIVGLVATLYAEEDVPLGERRYGFFAFLLLLVGGVSGAFMTGDIFNLYVWFEVLLISSFGLIIYGGEKIQLDGAVKYAVLNLIATTLFLTATGLLYGLTGTLNFADLARVMPELQQGAPLAAIGALFLLAFGMKAAGFPVNFWLPASYHTPKLVVSAVFAGLLTKVGIYALFRVTSLVFPTPPDVFRFTLIAVAIATMLIGVFGALAQNNVRRLLGFLVVSGIGMMLVGVALATEEALMGALFYALHSIIVMTALYFAVGVIERTAGTNQLTALGGLYRHQPFFAAIFLILSFAVAGLPPFSGFWPKVVLVKASLAVEENVLTAAILVTGFLTTLAMGRVWALTFWRPADAVSGVSPPAAEDGLRPMLVIPMGVLTALVVIVGLFPETVFALAETGAKGLIDPSDYVNATLAPYDALASDTPATAPPTVEPPTAGPLTFDQPEAGSLDGAQTE